MNYTDKELYKKCLELSKSIKMYRNIFISLIPLVEKRKLYLKYNMHSVYEFAAKLAGISNDTVAKVLRIDHKLKKCPKLKLAFESGSVSWTKFEALSVLILPENDSMLAEKLPTMSVDAIRLLVRESKVGDKTLKFKKANTELLSVKVSVKTMRRLKVLKAKLERDFGYVITWDKAFSVFLDQLYSNKLDDPILNSKKEIPTEGKEKVSKVNRYIPAKVKKSVLASTKGLCAKCDNPAKVLHHQIPYSVSKSHESLVPLCRGHHDLVHHQKGSNVNLYYQMHKRLVGVVEEQTPDYNYDYGNRKPEVVVVNHSLDEG